jgi:N-acetylmuramoyl-L-alanine amidase
MRAARLATVYSQNDPAWRTTRLGAGPLTIGSNGCYVTSDAMLMSWAGHPIDPSGLNAFFVQHGVYASGDLLYDTALAVAFPDLWKVEEVYKCESFPCDRNKLNNDDARLYVIVEILGPRGMTHFSPVTHWQTWTIADAWDGVERSIGQRGQLWGWGGDSAALVAKVIRLRYVGGGQSGGSPLPPPAEPGTFVGVTADGGVHVRERPGTDQPLVLQPPPGDPTVVDGGVTLTFDGWCHHPARGGEDTVPLDHWTGQPDDRWFKVQGTSHWIASANINGNPGSGFSPLPDPGSVLPPAPPPAPVPVPPAPVPSVPQVPPATSAFRDPLATWKGPVPNMVPGRQERVGATGWDHTGDPSAPTTGPSYNLNDGMWVVMHHMDGTAAGADGRFQTPGQLASAHYGLLRSGEVWQWVGEEDAADGASNYWVNCRCVNFEHEDNGSDAYTQVQLRASAELLAQLHIRRGLPLQRGDVRAGVWGVLGHNEVPGAATACPGTLPIDAILELARPLVQIPPPPDGPVPPPPDSSAASDPWFALFTLLRQLVEALARALGRR